MVEGLRTLALAGLGFDLFACGNRAGQLKPHAN